MPKVETSKSITGVAEGRPDYSELMTGDEKIAFKQTVEGLMQATGTYDVALSSVTIGADKDWGGYRITNLGGVDLQEIPTSDHTGSGIYITDTVGETVAIGDVLYMKSDGSWWKADADASTTMPGAGLAMEAKSAGGECKILLHGFFRDDSWNWTVGGASGILYVSTTPGSPTQTAPSGTGDQVQVLGIAITADVILFNPSYELVEVS